MTVSDFILRRLSLWGIKRVFGYPGDGINGLMGAFERAGDSFEFVQVRHEEMAAFMACAHAKIAGAWEAALKADRPVFIEAVTDPNVPSLAPHIMSKQAEAFSKAMLKGDPEHKNVMRQTIRDFFH